MLHSSSFLSLGFAHVANAHLDIPLALVQNNLELYKVLLHLLVHQHFCFDVVVNLKAKRTNFASLSPRQSFFLLRWAHAASHGARCVEC